MSRCFSYITKGRLQCTTKCLKQGYRGRNCWRIFCSLKVTEEREGGLVSNRVVVEEIGERYRMELRGVWEIVGL